MECLMAGCFAKAPMVGHACPTFPEGLSSAGVATPIWVIPVAKGGERIKEEPAK